MLQTSLRITLAMIMTGAAKPNGSYRRATVERIDRLVKTSSIVNFILKP